LYKRSSGVKKKMKKIAGVKMKHFFLDNLNRSREVLPRQVVELPR